MRIGYFVQTEGPHLDMARHLIDSAKHHMPGVEVCQLTDADTPILDGATGIRLAGDMPMGVRRLSHYAMLKGDWLLLDTDILIRKDVRDVFSKPFDVAVASREGTYMHGSKYAEIMPYNFGVIFSKNPEPWRLLLPNLKKMTPELQEWGGEQFLLCQMMQGIAHLHGVHILPSAYNFTPEKRTDDVSHVALLHLKGPRKAWLNDFLEAECTT